MANGILLKAFPRVHMTLIDLANATFRQYGGAGFTLNTFPVEVEAALALTNALTFGCKIGERDLRDAENLMHELSKKLSLSFEIHVRSLPPLHMGFGSKTALLLAIGAACNALSGTPLPPLALQKISGRGGTSGVGINTFFRGGIVIDLGHPGTSSIAFHPSSAHQASGIPPVSIGLPFPEEWKIHLFIPKGREYAGDEEVRFFKKNAPIPRIEALSVLAAVYHGIVPAFLEKNIDLLKIAVAELHSVGFKRRELQGQSEGVIEILTLLSKQDCIAAGMSSMGPLVYAIAPAEESDMMEKLTSKIQGSGMAECLGTCKGRNIGHESTRNRHV